uniref:Probable aspartyl protease At4g16563 n=1 Tax=Tanacetum cinerariifolium TaxID=118510 RepID=A0A6L2MKA0_TANCI|nr:probable aspartyl protease At4g16563 [Tanacetum cinerariifolium]
MEMDWKRFEGISVAFLFPGVSKRVRQAARRFGASQKLYQDVLQLPMSAPPSLTVENITFGCAHEALAEPVGVAGFGRGALSLPAQLSAYSPNLGSQRVDPPVKVNNVKQVSQPQPLAYIPMLENTKHPYYYYMGLEAVTNGKNRITAPLNMSTIDRKGNGGMVVDSEAVTVGKNRITAPLNMSTIDGKGNGGMVVDSGTTYSMLPEDFYNSVMGEFGRLVKSGYKRAQEVEDKTGLSPNCLGFQEVRNSWVSTFQPLGIKKPIKFRFTVWKLLENPETARKRIGNVSNIMETDWKRFGGISVAFPFPRHFHTVRQAARRFGASQKLYHDVLQIPMSAPPSLTVKTSLSAVLMKLLLSRQPSPLILGRRVDPPVKVSKVKQVSQPQPFAYTPMLENTKHPYYYYVGLEAVTVGKYRITAPLNMSTIDGKGNGGMVVDSSTTYSMLPEELYNSVVGEFGRLVKSSYKRAQEVEDKTGLSPCYYTDQPVGDTGIKKVKKVSVPQLVSHFGGNSSVVMPKKNYFYEFTDGKKVKRNVGCMTLMNAGYFPGSGGPAGLLGNTSNKGWKWFMIC